MQSRTHSAAARRLWSGSLVMAMIGGLVAASGDPASAQEPQPPAIASQQAAGSGNDGSWEPEYQTHLSDGRKLEIVRRPAAPNWQLDRDLPLTELPHYDPNSQGSLQVDLRTRNISSWDLQGRTDDLLHASFDSRTQWPKNLPAGFDPQAIMETGKNPGLNVRDLHRQGINGKGVGIAIIDQSLLVDHEEYRDRLKSYEEIHVLKDSPAAMHGPAVASIAVGRNTGVAPGADLYYIAETHGTEREDGFDWDFTWLAKSIDRVIEINKTLPHASRIRVISASIGWRPEQKGYAEVNQAVERARQAGIFVISSSLQQTDNLLFHGLGRDPRTNPDQASSYGPGSWWASSFLSGQYRFPAGTRLLAPMDARTTASPLGTNEYAYYASGGWSWTIPYLAGLYALACQVNPDITPEQFWAEGLRTGANTIIDNNGEKIDFGTIVQPVPLINAVRKDKHPPKPPKH